MAEMNIDESLEMAAQQATDEISVDEPIPMDVLQAINEMNINESLEMAAQQATDEISVDEPIPMDVLQAINEMNINESLEMAAQQATDEISVDEPIPMDVLQAINDMNNDESQEMAGDQSTEEINVNEPLRLVEHPSMNETWPKFSPSWTGTMVSNGEWLMIHEENMYEGSLYKFYLLNNFWREVQCNLPDMKRTSLLLVGNEVIVHGIVKRGTRQSYMTFAGDYTLSTNSITFRKIGELKTHRVGSYLAHDGTHFYTVTGIKTTPNNLSVYRLNNTVGLWDRIWRGQGRVPQGFTENRIFFYDDKLYLFPVFPRRKHLMRSYYGQYRFEEYYTQILLFNLKSLKWARQSTLPDVGNNFPGGEWYMVSSRPVGLSQVPQESRYLYVTGRTINATRDEPTVTGTWVLDIEQLQWRIRKLRGQGPMMNSMATAISPSGRLYICVRKFSTFRLGVWSVLIDPQVPSLRHLSWELIKYHFGKTLAEQQTEDERLPAEHAQQIRDARLNEHEHEILAWMEKYAPPYNFDALSDDDE